MATSSYKENQLLKDPEDFPENDCEQELIYGWFNNDVEFTQSSHGYVYYAGIEEPLFLCSNWAGWRASNLIPIGGKVPRGESIDTTDYTVEDVRQNGGLLAAMGLYDSKTRKYTVKPCDSNDPGRMLIFWTVVKPGSSGKPGNPEKEIIGHVSVKPSDRVQWESKLSTSPIVILHDEDVWTKAKGFLDKPEWSLRPALYYRYA